MTTRVVSPPPVEPITLAEAKLHLRETGTEQDAIITSLIVAARQYAENYTRRALVQQTLELLLPCFPWDGVIALPRPSLVSVTSVKYIDTGGVLTTVDPSEYQVDVYRQPAYIKPAYLYYWKATRSSDVNAVQVRYVAGYPVGAGSPTDYTVNIPDGIKHWMRVRVAQLYEHREAMIAGTIVANVPRDYVDGLLDPFKVNYFY